MAIWRIPPQPYQAPRIYSQYPEVKTSTCDADVLFKKLGVLKTISTDALIKKTGLTISVTADLFITLHQKAIQADVLIQKSAITKTVTADALLLAPVTSSVTVDVGIKGDKVSVTADIWLKILYHLDISVTADVQLVPAFVGDTVNFIFEYYVSINAGVTLVKLNIDTTLAADVKFDPPFWDRELSVDTALKLTDIPSSVVADFLIKHLNEDAAFPVDVYLYEAEVYDPPLEEAQQLPVYKPAVSATFTRPGSPTYTHTWGNAIIGITEHIDPFKHVATIVLHNAKKLLTSVDFEGYSCVISWGIKIDGVAHAVDSPAVKVFSQTYTSRQGLLAVTLECKGIITMMDEERASTKESSATLTVRQWIDSICGATNAAYSHCLPHQTMWHNTDPTLDFVPGTSQFEIQINQNRSDALRYLLDRTNIVMRPESDGLLHFFTPKTTGDYDCIYELKGDHPFYTKDSIKTAVLPNYIEIRGQTNDSGVPTVSAHASDAESVALHGEWRYYENLSGLTTTEQCSQVATALLNKVKSNAKTAAINVPMDCFRRIYDRVNTVDVREGSSRDGNIGYINRYFNEDGYRMDIGYGGWLDYLKQQQFLKVTGGSGGGGTTFKFPEIPDTLSVSLPDTNLNTDEYIYFGTIYASERMTLYLHSVNIHANEGDAYLTIEVAEGGWKTIAGFPISANYSYKWEYPLAVYTAWTGTQIRFGVFNPSSENKTRYVNASVNYDLRNLYHEL